MSWSAIAQVDAYWEALRAGRAMPDRSEVDPRGLEAALGHTFLLERLAPGVARFRLAGRHLCDLMGMEVRGMPLSAFILPEARPQLAEVLASLSKQPGAATLELDSDRGIGRPPLAAQLYIAPLTSDGVPSARLLGCLQARGAVGRTPRRFAIAAVRARRTGPIEAAPSTAAPAEAPAMGMAEDAAPFDGAPRGRPHLRLVKS